MGGRDHAHVDLDEGGRPSLPLARRRHGALAHLALAPADTGGLRWLRGATLAEAVRVGRRVGVLAVPVVWAIFPILHASRGVGFAVGLVQYA